ncbi:MAG: hypothetical protein U9Q15_03185 [Patescibacteria group bacterium]|nr:hypothetical protein [Patescibacteria group bacterium]
MRSGDNSLLITTFSLTLFGVAMISSASTIIAFNNDVANSYYFW